MHNTTFLCADAIGSSPVCSKTLSTFSFIPILKTVCFQFRVVLFMLLIPILLSTSPVYAEHESHTDTFFISGTTAEIGHDMQEFTIDEDGALYFTLKSYSPGSTVPDNAFLVIGFMIIGCPMNYYESRVWNPELNKSYGPYYVEAGSHYKSYFWFNSSSLNEFPGTTYTMEIEFRKQLIENDPEPNDHFYEAKDIGAVSDNSNIYGHIGYIGCDRHDTNDYLNFTVKKSGSYDFYFMLDEIFSDTYDNSLFEIILNDEGGNRLGYWAGPSSVNYFGPIDMDSSQTYRLIIKATNYHEIEQQPGVSVIKNNKAGGYAIKLGSELDPFTITKVTTDALVLLEGQNFQGNVSIKNNMADSYFIKFRIVLFEWVEEYDVWDGSRLMEWPVFLNSQELKIVTFSLDKLIEPMELTDIKGPADFKIQIDALLIEDEIETYQERKIIYFRIVDHRDVAPLIHILLKKK